jgi:hypothetical protein
MLAGCDGAALKRETLVESQAHAGGPATPARKDAALTADDVASLGEDAPPGTPPVDKGRPAADPATTPSMIIRTGQASLVVDSLDLAVARVRQLAQRVGGFVANSQMQAGENQLRSATLEIKVPADRFDELTGGLTPIGKVEYLNVSAEDVGEEFTDMTARVANAHRLEQRLIDLLATRTGKLSDVLEIERELARVRESIERMEGRRRYLKAHVAMSTLSVTVHEKPALVGQGSGSVIGEAFRQAWRNFVNFIAGFVESLGVVVPLAVLGIALVLGLRRVWRRRAG